MAESACDTAADFEDNIETLFGSSEEDRPESAFPQPIRLQPGLAHHSTPLEKAAQPLLQPRTDPANYPYDSTLYNPWKEDQEAWREDQETEKYLDESEKALEGRPEESRKMAAIKLSEGRFILDVPTMDTILQYIPHAEPPERDEFTHLRYGTLSCSPRDFTTRAFRLRSQLFAEERKIEIMIRVTIPGSYSDHSKHDVKEALDLAMTLRSVIEFTQVMCMTKTKTWTGNNESWKKIIVVVSSARLLSPISAQLLQSMGIVQPWPLSQEHLQAGSETRKYEGRKYEDFPTSVNGENVQAR